MKRRFGFTLLTLLALLIPLLAQAGEWQSTPLRWTISNRGGWTGDGIWVRDTTFTVLNGANVLDTTQVFSPLGLGVVGHAQSGAVAFARDSMLVGWLEFQTDSSISVGAMSSLQIAIDGRIGGLGNPATLGEWVFVDSVSVAIANGTDAIIVPVRGVGVTGLNTLAFNSLRARSVSGVGTLAQARAVWRNWKPGDEGKR